MPKCRLYLEIDEDDFHEHWPDDITLEVLDTERPEVPADEDTTLSSSSETELAPAVSPADRSLPTEPGRGLHGESGGAVSWTEDWSEEAAVCPALPPVAEAWSVVSVAGSAGRRAGAGKAKEEDGKASNDGLKVWSQGDQKGEDISIGSIEWSEFCRICHDGAERGALVVPCRCTGSMQHVHNECLIRWILSSFNTHCEICLHRYRIGTTGMRLPHQWKLPQTDGVERYHMLLCLVALLVLAAVISFLVYVSTDNGSDARTYRNSPLAPALYAVYAALGLVCLGLASAEVIYTVVPLLERFRLTNMNLVVVPYDPAEVDTDTLDGLSAQYAAV